MMKIIPIGATQKFGRTVLTLKKNSPHIFFAGGIAGAITSTVLACRATLKLEPLVDDIRAEVNEVKQKNALTPEDPKQNFRDLTYVYGKSFKKIVFLYGPAAVLGTASIGALTGSHVQLTRRNSLLTATAAAISKAYDDYRDRVRAELGEEKELALHRSLTEQEVTIDGKKQKVKVVGLEGLSPYAQLFDESSPNWKKDPGLNQLWINVQQEHANHMLQSRGHLILNEVYDMLGLPRSPAGAVTGWVLNGPHSDNYVSFGLEEAYAAPFVNGDERCVILDFNVDGIVYDQI